MKLYYSNGSCSLASMIALEEAGAKYDSQRVNLREGEQRKPEYLKINPKGKVPALQLDDGTALTENPAIISFVADTHAAAELLGKPGDLHRARAQEWLAWSSAAVHPGIGGLFRNKEDENARKNAQAVLDQYNDWLRGTYVLGDKFSAADCYTPVFTLWAASFGLTIGDKIKQSMRALQERPGVQRAFTTQQLQFPKL